MNSKKKFIGGNEKWLSKLAKQLGPFTYFEEKILHIPEVGSNPMGLSLLLYPTLDKIIIKNKFF